MNGPAETEEELGTEAEFTSVRPACVNAFLAGLRLLEKEVAFCF